MRIMARAYSELSTTRGVGMTIGPIPWTAMLEWCRWHGLDRDLTDHVVRVLRLVDAETLRRANQRARSPAKG